MERKNKHTSKKRKRTEPTPPSSGPVLPVELFEMIADLIVDTDTLDNLCKATLGNSCLYEISVRMRWKTATLDDRDLMPDPGYDKRRLKTIEKVMKERQMGRHWKPVGKTTKMLLRPFGKWGYCPANYVQELIVDLRLLRHLRDSGIQNFKEKITVGRGYERFFFFHAKAFVPSVDSLEHTLMMLHGRLHDLRRVSCYGDAPQELLDFITSQEVTRIRSLELRKYTGWTNLRVKRHIHSSWERDNLCYSIEMDKISRLDQLESLAIHHLQIGESSTLATTLPKLTKLRCLTLTCCGAEHKNYVGCALQSFFKSVFRHCNTASTDGSLANKYTGSFLPDLVSLSLACPYEDDEMPLPLPPPPQPFRLANDLTRLYVDVTDVKWIEKFVDCFPEDTLQFISVPGSSSFTDDWFSSGGHGHVSHVIKNHKRSLKRFRLTRAWETNGTWINRLNSLLKGEYAVQELVLGTRSPDWYHDYNRIPVSRGDWVLSDGLLSSYLYGFIEGSYRQGKPRKWGTQLRRIRIDHVNLSSLDVSAISHACYSHLKILMLQPNFCEMDAIAPIKRDSVHKAGYIKLAKDIMFHGPSTLRVIVIASHWYWVSRDKAGGEHESSLWPWATARKDLTQNEIISSTLDEADLDFLRPSAVPSLYERDQMEWYSDQPDSQPTTSKPSDEMFCHWNCLGVFPVC